MWDVWQGKGELMPASIHVLAIAISVYALRSLCNVSEMRFHPKCFTTHRNCVELSAISIPRVLDTQQLEKECTRACK